MKSIILIVLLFVSFAFANVNINSADAKELKTLKGVGKATADRIIKYRTEHPFKTKHDIVKVKGIGEKSYEKLKKDISV